MGRGQVLGAALQNRHRYLWQDPVRFGCVVAAGMLTFLPVIPFTVTLFIVAILQLSAVALVSRFSLPGWSHQWGRRLHPGILATSLCMDWTNLCACTLVGAMLLIRHFNGVEALPALGVLVAGVCLLPDVRFCRWLLASDPLRRSDHLRTGYFWRDPVKLAAMLSCAIVCQLDRGILAYLLLSVSLFQLNVLLVFLDKYLAEIEVRESRGVEAIWAEREGRRLLICLSPLGLLPVRLVGGDPFAWFLTVTIAGLIIVPDLLRFAVSLLGSVWEWIVRPRQPSTIIGIPTQSGS